MYYTYILVSEKFNAYYVGYTANLNHRLLAHNNGMVRATKNRGPWKIFYHEKFETEVGAVQRERQIKSWKSRKAIERLKFYQNRGSSTSYSKFIDESRDKKV
ncbi:GIY-YIG nuclease family protein [Candidatus Giovannonibacteria bacterium]|nr:GIY-YIG nuclease family protein [Candidatus Giovannonibacteria bacterium]